MEAKCIAPISLHGVGECVVGKSYTLPEDILKYNGGAFDLKNAKLVSEEVLDDGINDPQENNEKVHTKQEIIEKTMADNNAQANAKEAEAAAEMGMTLEDYREHVKGLRKPMAEVVATRETRGKELSKMNKDPLIELAKNQGAEVADTDTREILITKILDKEFPAASTVVPTV